MAAEEEGRLGERVGARGAETGGRRRMGRRVERGRGKRRERQKEEEEGKDWFIFFCVGDILVFF